MGFLFQNNIVSISDYCLFQIFWCILILILVVDDDDYDDNNDNVWDDATDWCKWLEWWGIMRIDIWIKIGYILQMSVTDLLT